MLHRDHGSVDKWIEPEFSIQDVKKLSNGNLTPFVFNINCQGGMFQMPSGFTSTEYPDGCLAENFLKKENGGCIGIFAASHNSKTYANEAFTLEMFSLIWPDANFKYSFPDYVPSSKSYESFSRVGELLQGAFLKLRETYSSSINALYNQEVFHCFGDPTMAMYTKQSSHFNISMSRKE